MPGVKNLKKIISELNPLLIEGEYVFVSVKDLSKIDRELTICEFKEKEGITVVLEKNKADEIGYSYDFIASWITLQVHSSLHSVGLTALVSTELAKNNIGCNVIAGYYHDHIFVNKNESEKAIEVLNHLTKSYN